MISQYLFCVLTTIRVECSLQDRVTYSSNVKEIGSVRVVDFKGSNFCGLGSQDDFVVLYFSGIV